jgi:hypothetical protein
VTSVAFCNRFDMGRLGQAFDDEKATEHRPTSHDEKHDGSSEGPDVNSDGHGLHGVGPHYRGHAASLGRDESHRHYQLLPTLSGIPTRPVRQPRSLRTAP